MSLDRTGAAKVAAAWGGPTQLDFDAAVETEHGWFFPPIADGRFGSSGVIIGKSDGAGFVLGSAYSVDRDIRFYDRGFRSKVYDLVVLEVFDLSAAVAIMRDIGPTVVRPTYETGTVWRVPMALSDEEVFERLSAPPAVFHDIGLYFRLELLDRAEEKHIFNYRALPRTSTPK
jgi:hypothetical protein